MNYCLPSNLKLTSHLRDNQLAKQVAVLMGAGREGGREGGRE